MGRLDEQRTARGANKRRPATYPGCGVLRDFTRVFDECARLLAAVGAASLPDAAEREVDPALSALGREASRQNGGRE